MNRTTILLCSGFLASVGIFTAYDRLLNDADPIARVGQRHHLVNPDNQAVTPTRRVDSTPGANPDAVPVFLERSLRHGLDTTVSPCDDFDQYVNGGWRATTVLPKQVFVLDVFRATSDQTQKLLVHLVDSAGKIHTTTANVNMRLVGQYYSSCLAADSLDRSMRATSMLGAPKHDTSRSARCARLTINDLQEAVGQLFVDAVVPKANEPRVQQLLDNIRSAAAQRIDKLPWLTTEAKGIAKSNLAKMTLRVAKPKSVVDYHSLQLPPTDFVGNHQKVKEFLWQRQIARTGRSEPSWSQNQFTANALYQLNSIEVPAFMFQWPLFDAHTEEALSYAGVGMIIGHETYHGITEHTGASGSSDYVASAERLKTQYSNLKITGVTVNGAGTLNENLADLGGLLAAYDAWAAHARKRAVPMIDGFTPDQRFFVHYARLWRVKAGREYSPGSVHSHPQARINGVIPNIPAFAKAFGCRDGAPMARATGDRVEIW